jgi:transposase
MNKIDSRTLPLAALNERRRRAVKMRLQGTSLKETAAQCEMSRTTVISAVKAYKAGGWEAVQVDRGGRPHGSGRLLSAQQEHEIQQLIGDHTPDQLNMDWALWTRHAVAELIRDRFDIDLPVRTLSLYLSRWGFTPQKPLRKAHEQSPMVAKKWLDQQYPMIAASAKAAGAEIHWCHETGLCGDDVTDRSDAPQAQTLAHVTDKRHSLSVISSVTNKGVMRWKIFEGALDADILIEFLKCLVQDADRKVYLILDNLQVNHSQSVKAWLVGHGQKIQLFCLPSYSPELSPDGLVNAELKQAVTDLAAVHTKLELLKAPARHPRGVQHKPERIMSHFEHKPVHRGSSEQHSKQQDAVDIAT